MSKKHFIALADTLRSVKPKPQDPTWHYPEAVLQWEKFRNAVADFCKTQNSQFNRERWIDYIDGNCGPSGGAVKRGAA